MNSEPATSTADADGSTRDRRERVKANAEALGPNVRAVPCQVCGKFTVCHNVRESTCSECQALS